jgi:hypothetical protein
MIIRKADAATEAGALPTEQLVVDMMNYNEELVKAGIMLAGEGLKPTSHGARVRFGDGPPTVTDGPFTEAKELIAGFTMIDVRSKAEAIEWMKRWPPLDGDGAVELELRQVLTADDFGDALTPELRDAEARLRETSARKR